MKFKLFIFFSGLFILSCLYQKGKINQFKISEDYYFETRVLGNRGYTWIYLCMKNSSLHVDLYGERDSTTSSYFMDIDSIKINKIKGDTIIYSIFESGPGNKFCILDSLILGKRKLLSFNPLNVKKLKS